MSKKLTHIDEHGQAHMVDVGGKPITERLATARGEVQMLPETLKLIMAGAITKGDVIAVAKIAGIQAAKRTSELIPLCHPIPVSKIDVELDFDKDASKIIVTSTVKTNAQTGVEMEALTAVSIACLTVYDMAKAVEKKMRIQNICLVEKRGGLSGDVVND